MELRKRILLIATGGTIASKRTEDGLTPGLSSEELLSYIPEIAVIQDRRIVFFINDKDRIPHALRFYHELDGNIFLLKLIPGIDGKMLDMILDRYDGVIIESFGVGGFPDYGDHSFFEAIERGVAKGKIIVMATQVTHEGSDMSVYQVGKVMKDEFNLIEAYDMTLEATVTKMMWALALCKDYDSFRTLFYRTVNHDMLFQNSEHASEI